MGAGDSDSDESHEGPSPKFPPKKKAGKKASKPVAFSGAPDPESDTGEDGISAPKPVRAQPAHGIDFDNIISEDSEDEDSNSHIDLSMPQIPPQTKSPPKRMASVKKPPAYKASPVPFIRSDVASPSKAKMISGDIVKVSSTSGYLTTLKSDWQREADKIARLALGKNRPVVKDDDAVDKKMTSIFAVVKREGFNTSEYLNRIPKLL